MRCEIVKVRKFYQKVWIFCGNFMDIVISQPELWSQVSKPRFVTIPVAVEVHRAV